MHERCTAHWWCFYKMTPALRSGSQQQTACVNCCWHIVRLSRCDIDVSFSELLPSLSFLVQVKLAVQMQIPFLNGCVLIIYYWEMA